jgi:hypothetical protein
MRGLRHQAITDGGVVKPITSSATAGGLLVTTRSKQLNYQARLKAEGKCIRCAQPRDTDSTQYCAECLEKRRGTIRKRFGYQPWREGGRGRAPFSAA